MAIDRHIFNNKDHPHFNTIYSIGLSLMIALSGAGCQTAKSRDLFIEHLLSFVCSPYYLKKDLILLQNI